MLSDDLIDNLGNPDFAILIINGCAQFQMVLDSLLTHVLQDFNVLFIEMNKLF